jgi:hypothetical protein
LGRENLSLVAFSTSGAVLGQKDVTTVQYEITVEQPAWVYAAACALAGFGSACVVISIITGWGHTFNELTGQQDPLPGVGYPLPGVAISQDPRGGTPRVVVTDMRQDRVLYAFAMQYGFTELLRISRKDRSFTTPPVAFPDGTTLVGTHEGGLQRTLPPFAETSGFGWFGVLTAPPTMTKNGGIVVVSRDGKFHKIGGATFTPGGESIAPAAASCTHIYVSTRNALTTFDTNTLGQVGSVPWNEGGMSGPIIGPFGHVYAIANDTLFSFPAPKFGGVLGTTACDGLTTGSQQIVLR